MKTNPLLLACAIAAVATSCLAVWASVRLVDQNERLRDQLLELRTEVGVKNAEIGRLEAEADASAARLEAERLRADLAQTAPAPSTPGQPIRQRASRVRVVSGDRTLGGGWMVPGSEAPVGTVSGLPVEGVVVLDEAVRQSLAASKPPAASPELVRETSTVYYESYPYYVGYPLWVNGWQQGTQLCLTNLMRKPPEQKTLLPTGGKPFLNTDYYYPPNRPFLPSGPNAPAAVAPATPIVPAATAPVRVPLNGATETRRTRSVGR